ncbi:MAG: hypothetical protein GF365_05170 [Candidatus Buchananbacteria bacterium]|nr:hypothetical protein [Candidatus Buchananbacteria bacterium]
MKKYLCLALNLFDCFSDNFPLTMLGLLIVLTGFAMCWAFEDYQGFLIVGAFSVGLLIGDISRHCGRD